MLKKFSDYFLENKKWLAFLVLINIGGFIYGIYYYSYQLSITQVYLWPFTIDSPLYVIFFAFTSYLLYKNKRIPNWFLFLTAVGLIKVGIWTTLVLWFYSDYYFATAFALNIAILILHVGMVLEGLVLIPRFSVKTKEFLAVLAWFLFNDWLDYFAGIHTLIPEGFAQLLMYESFGASILLTNLLFWLKREIYLNKKTKQDS